MKKTILILIPCILFSCQIAYSQIEGGVMAGINFNSPKINGISTSGPDNDIGSGNFGFHVGLYATIDFELFAIQPEVYFSQQGGKFSFSNTTQEHEIKMSYIQIPVLYRYNFLEYFHALAGPQFGIPIQSEVSFGGGSPTDIKDQTKGLDVAAVLGVGLTIPNMGVNGSLRWSKGFSNMIDSQGATSAGTITSLKNSMIQISASYAFGGGR